MGDSGLTTERAYWVAWAQAKGLGSVLLKRLNSHFGSLAAAWQAEESALLEVEGVGLGLASQLADYRQQVNPDDVLIYYEGQGANFWTPADPDYPTLLYEITDPPPLLYYQGRTELAQAVQTMPSVAIVGTREPSDYGQRWTRRLVQQLVSHDVIVVSGLASGIDRHAHGQALDSQGLTIAVLGTGVDRSYPWNNRALQDRIAQEGLLLSEHPNDTPPDRTYFPRRNRIIAGLSLGCLVVEAAPASGSLITARDALEAGREVLAVPGSIHSPQSRGCHRLIRDGAVLVETLADILDALPLGHLEAGGGRRAAMAAGTVEAALPASPLLAALGHEPSSLDALVARSGLATPEVLAGLMALELDGHVGRTADGRFQRVHRGRA